MKRRVLIEGNVLSQPRKGGIWRTYNEVIPRIVNMDSEISFLVHLPIARPLPFSKSRHIRYWQEPRPGKWGWRKKVKEHVAKNKKSNIFHAIYYEVAPWQGMLTVSTVYDFIDARFPLFKTNGPNFIDQQRKSLQKSQVMVAISEATKSDAVYFFNIPPEKIIVIPLSANEIFSQQWSEMGNLPVRRFTQGRKYWLYVGDRTVYKNFDVLLHAFVQVAKQTEEDLLIIGGSDNLESRQLELLVRERLEDRVHMFSRPSDAELHEVYSEASAFVYPSLAEGFGIPVLEAMASGAPTILSDISVFHEVSGGAAMFFDPRDAEALADCLLTVFSQSEKLSLAGRENAARYDWSKTAKRFAEVYESLL